MIANDSALKRYALAYIKKSDDNSNVKDFLLFLNTQNTTDWSEENFDRVYEAFKCSNSNDRQNRESGNDYAGNNRQPTGPQVTHVYVHKRGLDLWDYLLLRNLFGGHTTVINNHGFSSGNQQSREDKKKDSEDSRKLLALGIAAVVVCVSFHAGMCFWYNSSRKAARKEEKIDYLDNKLQTFRNIEFTIGAVSLAALICCAVNPVLPAWGLIILGVNSLVCLAGGLAFHMKHEKELDNIDKAEKAVNGITPSAPPLSEFDDPSVAGQQSKNY